MIATLERTPLSCITTLALLTLLAPTPAKAAVPTEVQGEGELGGETSEATESDTEPKTSSEGSTQVDTGRTYSARTPDPEQDRWIDRYPPRHGMFEVGVYGGVWFPSRRLELFGPDPAIPDQGYQPLQQVTFTGGLRAGFYPLRFLGVEGEGGIMPGRTLGTEAWATAWALRAHLVGQLGFWSVTPFLLAGVGLIGMSAESAPQSLGTDQDVAIHFGGGVKVFVRRNIQLRLDIRDIVSNRRGVGEGLTSSPEILLGVSFSFGGKRSDRPSPTPIDHDGDGVPDEDDYCPETFGAAPRGCPNVCVDDNDVDGLSNIEDACPLDPESRNGFEDGDGCPDQVPSKEIEEVIGVIIGIQFDTDKDTIKADSRPILDHAIEVLKRHEEMRVEIVGHTDNQGGYRHNVELSQNRATAVKRYLTDAGIDADRLETRGAGPNEPIETNETPEGRAANRRIEFKMLEPSP